MQLSKHFTLREMTNSMTAQRKGIDNTPGSAEIKNLGDKDLMNLFIMILLKKIMLQI